MSAIGIVLPYALPFVFGEMPFASVAQRDREGWP
jgi:hypothetical protein